MSGPLSHRRSDVDVVGGPAQGADEEQTQIAQHSVDASRTVAHHSLPSPGVESGGILWSPFERQ
jgi:hypothetical protein